MSDNSIQQRKDYLTYTGIIFLVGFIIYGLVALAIPNGIITDMTKLSSFFFFGFGGGYMLFSMLSGLLFVIKFMKRQTKTTKIIYTIFFPIPIFFAMAGMFYSLPYYIYNIIKIKNR